MTEKRTEISGEDFRRAMLALTSSSRMHVNVLAFIAHVCDHLPELGEVFGAMSKDVRAEAISGIEALNAFAPDAIRVKDPGAAVDAAIAARVAQEAAKDQKEPMGFQDQTAGSFAGTSYTPPSRDKLN